MDVVVADGRSPRAANVAAAVRPPAAPVRDPTQFLDVDVDELAGPARVDAPDDAPRWTIEDAELVESLAHEHAMHRRGMHLHDPADTSRAELLRSAQLLDPTLRASRCLCW